MTYADLGGIDNVLSDIKELIEHPLQHPEVSLITRNLNPECCHGCSACHALRLPFLSHRQMCTEEEHSRSSSYKQHFRWYLALYCSKQTALERQLMPCMYLAHHELESVSIMTCKYCELNFVLLICPWLLRAGLAI